MPAVVALTFQNTPEPLHWTVVNAMRNTGHALDHARMLQFVVEGAVRILKTTVTVEQWVCIGIGGNGSVKGLEYQWIIVTLTYHKGNNAAIIQIKDCTQINFVNDCSFIPLEFRHIGKPLRVWFRRMEITIQYIFSNILRILSVASAAVVLVLNGRLDALDLANTQYVFVIDMNPVVMLQVIPDTPVSFVRALHVNGFDLIGKFLVFRSSLAGLTGDPAVISSSRYA